MLVRVGLGDEGGGPSLLSGGRACVTSRVGGGAGVGTGVDIAGAPGGVVALFTEGAIDGLTGAGEDEAIL
jgi:hypothetical protein